MIVVSGLPCCCLRVTIAIAIASVGLCSGCSCTYREGQHDDKDVDSRHLNIVVDDKGLLRETSKQTKTHYTVIVTEAIETNARYIDTHSLFVTVVDTVVRHGP